MCRVVRLQKRKGTQPSPPCKGEPLALTWVAPLAILHFK